VGRWRNRDSDKLTRADRQLALRAEFAATAIEQDWLGEFIVSHGLKYRQASEVERPNLLGQIRDESDRYLRARFTSRPFEQGWLVDVVVDFIHLWASDGASEWFRDDRRDAAASFLRGIPPTKGICPSLPATWGMKLELYEQQELHGISTRQLDRRVSSWKAVQGARSEVWGPARRIFAREGEWHKKAELLFVPRLGAVGPAAADRKGRIARELRGDRPQPDNRVMIRRGIKEVRDLIRG
jgi:hypothetical protein